MNQNAPETSETRTEERLKLMPATADPKAALGLSGDRGDWTTWENMDPLGVKTWQNMANHGKNAVFFEVKTWFPMFLHPLSIVHLTCDAEIPMFQMET